MITITKFRKFKLTKKYIFIFFAISLLIILISITFVAIIVFFDEEKKVEGPNDESDQTEEPSRSDEYSDYPEIEPMIGKTLEEIEQTYPGGNMITSNTTWGDKWYSYEYENDLFFLYVDGRADKIVHGASLAIKKLSGCKLNETVLNMADTAFPYAGIDPTKKGEATNPGIWMGLASYYDYRENFVLSITCRTDLDFTMYYQVGLFDITTQQ